MSALTDLPEAWERLSVRLARRGFPVRDATPLPGDVSPRRYLRVELSSGGTAILALYPPALEQACRRFASTTALLQEVGVRVPRILAVSHKQEWMLLEDTGSRTLFDLRARGWRHLRPYLEHARAIALRIATLDRDRVAALGPPLDAALLRDELRQTWEVFLRPHGLAGEGELRRRLRAALDALCTRLSAETPVPCHRDFMARNLAPLEPAPLLAVLDHQDLRPGPPFYDLASLLNDSLFPPWEMERELLAPVLGGTQDRERYERAAAQRALKAIGTFAAFARRGFDRHLPLIAPTLARALRHLGNLPETRPLAPELARLWEAALPGR